MKGDKSESKKSFNYLLRGLVGNSIILAIFYFINIFFDKPQIYIENKSALLCSVLLLIIFFIVVIWSVWALIKNKTTKRLTAGPYKFVRYPIYSVIIFLFNPALAVYLRSWLLLAALIPAYFLWRNYANDEDLYLAKKFGKEYLEYQNSTQRFLPNLWRLNKTVFYFVAAGVIFVLAFIVFNFSAIYLRWVVFGEQKQQEITLEVLPQQPPPSYFQEMFDNNTATALPEQKDMLPEQEDVPPPKPTNYSGNPNSISIPKIRIDAPLVIPNGTTQKELNDALNQGVIIYPGSALPGQNGEVFLSGHSSSYPWIQTKYGQVFTLLDKLGAGDTVSLFYDHRQYDYRVLEKQILSPADTKLSETKEPVLTLMTCWPIGTALKRLVVRAELIK